MQFSTVLWRIMFCVCVFVCVFLSGLRAVIFLIKPPWLYFSVAWIEITIRNNNICGQNMRAHFIVYHFSTVFKIQNTWGYCEYSAQTWNYCHYEWLYIKSKSWTRMAILLVSLDLKIFKIRFGAMIYFKNENNCDSIVISFEWNYHLNLLSGSNEKLLLNWILDFRENFLNGDQLI